MVEDVSPWIESALSSLSTGLTFPSPSLCVASLRCIRGFDALDCVGPVAQQAFTFDTGHDDLLAIASGHQVLFVSWNFKVFTFKVELLAGI